MRAPSPCVKMPAILALCGIRLKEPPDIKLNMHAAHQCDSYRLLFARTYFDVSCIDIFPAIGNDGIDGPAPSSSPSPYVDASYRRVEARIAFLSDVTKNLARRHRLAQWKVVPGHIDSLHHPSHDSAVSKNGPGSIEDVRDPRQVLPGWPPSGIRIVMKDLGSGYRTSGINAFSRERRPDGTRKSHGNNLSSYRFQFL